MRGEDGSVTAEYATLLVLVAVLVLAVPAATIGGYVVALVQAGVCRITGSLCGGVVHGDDDFAPARCTVSERSYRGELELSVAFFQTRAGMSFARTERSDGTTAFTLVDHGSLGLTAGLGAEAGIGRTGARLGADAEVGLVGQVGDTWIVTTGQADDLQRRLAGGEVAGRVAGRAATALGWSLGNPWLGGVLRDAARAGADRVADQFLGELPPPDVTYATGGISGDASAGLWTPWLVEARTGVSAGILVGREEVAVDAATTGYLRVEAAATAAVGFGLDPVEVDIGGRQGLAGSVRATRDGAGDLVQLELVTTFSGRAVTELVGLADVLPTVTGSETSSVVHTTTIPLSSPADRDIAERWMSSLGTRGITELADLAHRQGRVSVVSYKGLEGGLSLGAKVALGPKAGGGGDVGRGTTDVVDAYYLGAPQASGRRDFVPFTACTAD